MLEKKIEETIRNNFGKLSYAEIGSLVDMSGRMVRYHCRKTLGLGTIKTVKPWSEKEIEIMNIHYRTNPNIYSLLSNRSKQSIYYKAWELGLYAKGRGEVEGNIFFFNKWSKEMAYILGLICADGNIFGDVLTIVQKDANYLRKIADTMGFVRTAVRKSTTGIDLIAIRNKVITDDLKRLGVMENKSLVLDKIPVPEKFMSNFILGYFDGDGCFCNTVSHDRPAAQWELLGTYNFLNWISAEIARLTSVPRKLVKRKNKGSKIFTLKYTCRDHIKDLCDWLYTNNPLYLKRKRSKYNDFLGIHAGKFRVDNTQATLH